MVKKSETIKCAEYDSLVAGMEAAKEQVRVAGKQAVAALFKAFFEEYPAVKAVGWTQYTPYFNDGEPCVFGVGEPYLTTKSGDFSEMSSLYDDEDDESGYCFKSDYYLKGPLKTAIGRLAASMDNDIFESAFGDHVLVIATPAGFHVNEYNHD